MNDRDMSRLLDATVTAVHPLRVMLFGSAARGNAAPDSDVDVRVVVPAETHRRKTAQALYKRLIGLPVPLDIVVAACSDLRKHADTPGLVYREILRDGKLLYAAP